MKDSLVQSTRLHHTLAHDMKGKIMDQKLFVKLYNLYHKAIEIDRNLTGDIQYALEQAMYVASCHLSEFINHLMLNDDPEWVLEWNMEVDVALLSSYVRELNPVN